MPRIQSRIRSVLTRVDSRFTRSRPGSVLILVVALLVLMALIGTAYLVTARNDRVATRLYQHNVQIDLLVSGVVNMAQAAISDTTYQHSATNGPAQRFDDWFTTGLSTPVDPANPNPVNKTWLGARFAVPLIDALGSMPTATPKYPVPLGACVQINATGPIYMSVVDRNTTAATPGGNWVQWNMTPNSGFVWPAISGPLAANCYFEDPRYPAVSAQPNASTSGISTTRTCVAPWYVTINGKNYPALQYFNPNTKASEIALAASASGNGIADSFLWRLPIGTIDGITYYAAVRIIDDNSAVNLNTAHTSSHEFDATGRGDANLPVDNVSSPGVFLSAVGLAEMTYTFANNNGNQISTDQSAGYGEMAALDLYRCNGQPRPFGIIGAGNTPGSSTPVDDYNNPRNDFYFRSVGDALWMGLGRRINNPGNVTAGLPFQALGWNESAILAHKYDIIDGSASPSVAEQCLVNSLYSINGTPGVTNNPPPAPTYMTTPWDPANASSWTGQYNEATPKQVLRRAYFVARNPVSNLMPSHDLGADLAGGFQPGLPVNPYTSCIVPYMIGANNNYATTGVIPRVSLNTAPITALDYANASTPTLWMGFYNAMADALPGGASAAANSNGQALAGTQQFRESLRDPNGLNLVSWFSVTEMVLLRSLLAACNAKDLRDSDDIPTGVPVPNFAANLPDASYNSKPTNVNLIAFGAERQPYITEIYVNNDNTVGAATIGVHPNAGAGKQNLKGYVAVELYNPYDLPMDISGWTLGILNRSISGSAANPYPHMKMVPITGFAGFPAGTILPSKTYLVLENTQATPTGSDATWRPFVNYKNCLPGGAGNNVAPTSVFHVANLHEVLNDKSVNNKPGGELYLLRPAAFTGNALPSFNITNPLHLMAPVDSFDFTGMILQLPTAKSFFAAHYVRITPGNMTSTNSTTAWRFVYPGRWADPTVYGIQPHVVMLSNPTTTAYPICQEGIAMSTWDSTSTQKYDGWVDAPPGGGASGPGTPQYYTKAYLAPIALGLPTVTSSYVNLFPAIQISNTDMGGPSKLNINNPVNVFPFGGFARVGDVLQVPFIGSYSVFDSTGNLVEMNPITRDCAFADDNDGQPGGSGTDDAYEQIGRFCPIYTTLQPSEAIPIVPGSNPQTPIPDNYAWAAHVFDYFTTIQNPNDDYLPNADPAPAAYNAYVTGRWNTATQQYAAGPNSAQTPTPVPNFSGTNSATSNHAGVLNNEDLGASDGQINVNTASWPVINAVPFTQTYAGYTTPGGQTIGVFSTPNTSIARGIVTFRNTYGPFKTLFDLNKVTVTGGTGFTALSNFYGNPATVDYNGLAGDFSPFPYPGTAAPAGGSSDFVTNDFETRYGTLTRVSNLLTTRSDTYTVYVLVQGWSGVGTANPQVVVQRRSAFIADRTGLIKLNGQTTASGSLNITPVPTN